MTDYKPPSSTPMPSSDSASHVGFERLAVGLYPRADMKNATSEPALAKKWHQRLWALPAYYWVLIAQVMVVLPHAAVVDGLCFD